MGLETQREFKPFETYLKGRSRDGFSPENQGESILFFCYFWKVSVGYYGCMAVDCVGRGGGLALLWKREVVDFEVLCLL